MGSGKEGITILGVYDVGYYISNIAYQNYPGESYLMTWISNSTCAVLSSVESPTVLLSESTLLFQQGK